MKRKQVGMVGVDAGLIMVGDPCYFWPNKENKKTTATASLPTWSTVIDALYAGKEQGPGKNDGHQLAFAKGHDGLGVIVETTHGDGTYPVFLETEGGRRRLVVELD